MQAVETSVPSPGRGWAVPEVGAWPGWADVRRQILDRVSRRRLRELQLELDWARFARPKVPVFKPDELRHLIRLDRNGHLVLPTLPTAWLRESYPNDAQLWTLPDIRLHLSRPSAAPPPPLSATPVRWSRWESAARGWAVGAVLLAVFVLLVRIAEKCLDKKFFKLRRRRSEEWPTPVVLATSQQHTIDELTSDLRDTSEGNLSVDLPPPYSECAATGSGSHLVVDLEGCKRIAPSEEPPPPYSACYVSFDPKLGEPSVHFCNTPREGDTVHTPNEAESSPAFDSEETGDRNHLANIVQTSPQHRIIFV